jgi:two-component system response regulator
MNQKQITGPRIAHILLVEDNPDDAEITRRAFEHAKIGNPLTVVEDGQAALDLLYRNCGERDDPSVDMLLLDLGLPKFDGHALLREVWADKRLRHIPVVVLSGSERDEDVIQAYKGGAQAFLRKPVDVERLLVAVRDLRDYQLFIAWGSDARLL